MVGHQKQIVDYSLSPILDSIKKWRNKTAFNHDFRPIKKACPLNLIKGTSTIRQIIYVWTLQRFWSKIDINRYPIKKAKTILIRLLIFLEYSAQII